MRSITSLAFALALTTAAPLGAQSAASQSAASQSAASPGSALLTRMNAAYKGKWYNTLTFVQRTIVARANGAVDTTTWYESLSGPTRLRIDMGSPALGNGVLYTADSTTRVRGGVANRTTVGGNIFLPLIMGVYLQPLTETERQLRLYKFDLARTHDMTWQGRKTVVVGTDAATDSLSPQFWVDTERLVVVRVRGALFGAQVSTIELGGYEKIGEAWLATRVAIITGAQRQTEEYSDWKANVALAEALFDPSQWKSAPHWAQGKHAP